MLSGAKLSCSCSACLQAHIQSFCMHTILATNLPILATNMAILPQLPWFLGRNCTCFSQPIILCSNLILTHTLARTLPSVLILAKIEVLVCSCYTIFILYYSMNVVCRRHRNASCSILCNPGTHGRIGVTLAPHTIKQFRG